MATKKKGNPGTRKSVFQLGADRRSEVISESGEPLFTIQAKFNDNVSQGPRKCTVLDAKSTINGLGFAYCGTGEQIVCLVLTSKKMIIMPLLLFNPFNDSFTPPLDTKSYFVARGRVPRGVNKQGAAGATPTCEKILSYAMLLMTPVLIFTLLFLVARTN
jgi:hypothetical protein